MSKKINQVFLNATEEQIEEYGLKDGVTNFSSLEKLIETVKADLEKKTSERVYTIAKGFTIIDGAGDVSVDLKTIAKENKYRLSAIDFDKIITEATKVLYASTGTVDHRIASFESVGEAEVKNLNLQSDERMIFTVERSYYDATAAGEKEYEEDVAKAQKLAVAYGETSDSKIVGYKDVTIENSGVAATVTTEGEKMARVATITTPTAVSVIGGNNKVDYQYDSTKAVDKKDTKLVVEKFTENYTASLAASGTATVTDSQVNNINGDVSEQVAELKKLHPNADFDKLIGSGSDASGYETVTIDNSTVLGKITGGSTTVTKTSSGSKDNFLDKQDLSGCFYAEAEAKAQQPNLYSSDNDTLYSHVTSFSMTKTEADAKATELEAKVAGGDSKIENLSVNKYEIVAKGIDNTGVAKDGQIKTGEYVYLSATEVAQLSEANQATLSLVESKVGFADYATDGKIREVTDDNFTTFTTAPTGNQLNKTEVLKYTFYESAHPTSEVGSYYLKAEELDDVQAALEAETGKSLGRKTVSGTEGYRAATSVTAENFRTEAVAAKVYAKYSDYAAYTFKKEMTADEAAAANKDLMAADDQQAWIKTTASDESVLFTVKKVSGGQEVTYYLTAAELSSLGAFGKDGDKNIVKSTAEVNVPNAFQGAETGWLFVDNANRLTMTTDATPAQLYRTGDAATAETLESFKTLTDANSSTEVPYYYVLKDVVYNTSNSGEDLLISQNDGAFKSYLGEEGEYVVDGEIQYRDAGYNLSGNIQGSDYVSSEKATINKAEYSYTASITTSLTEADAEEQTSAYPTDGELTQNKRIFKDAYVAEGENQYVTLEKAQESYDHEFIDVYAAQEEGNTYQLITGDNGLDTGIQATNEEGKKLYLEYDRAEVLITTDASKVNVAVDLYTKEDDTINKYALSEDEAAAINSHLGAGEKLMKVTGEGAKQYYRSYAFSTATSATLPDYTVANLNDYGALLSYVDANKTTALEACNTTTKIYSAKQGTDYSARLTVTVDGEEKAAYFNTKTLELTADEKGTFNAIYEYIKEGVSYYMTEAEAAKAVGATKVGQATDKAGKYMYRITEGTSTSLADYTVKYANYFVDAEAAVSKEIEFDEAWMAETYVTGQQVYKYTQTGDATVYYMTDAEALKCGLSDENKGEAVEGVVHYGTLANGSDKLASYTVATTRILDKVGTTYVITKDAEGNALQAVANDPETGVASEIYSNIGATSFAGTPDGAYLNKYVFSDTIATEATYYYTVDYTGDYAKSYSDEELALLKANEEEAGIATWKQSVDENGLITWTRTAATGEVSTYVADYASVDTADKGNKKTVEIATGAAIIKNGSVVKGKISGYKDVTVTDSKVGAVVAKNSEEVSTYDFSTKKGTIDSKTNAQTITTTEKDETTKKSNVIGSFTLANEKDLLDDDGAIETSTGAVAGYETVKVTNATTGTFSGGASESKITSKTVTDYAGDADDLRADYVNDWRTLANTGRESDGTASYVTSKVTSYTEETKNKSYAAGTFEATGRDYEFDVTAKNGANSIGDVSGYDQVTLTNVNAGSINSGSYVESTTKNSYTVKSNAKTGKDTVTNSGNTKNVYDSDGTLVASNDVTDTKNESDLTLKSDDPSKKAAVYGYQKVTLTNVGTEGDISSTKKTTSTTNGSATQEFDASTLRQVNIGGSQKYDTSAGLWSVDHAATTTSWNSTTGDYASGKLTSSKLTTSTVSAPDAALTAKGQFSTAAVKNEATLNKYTQASTGRELYLTEDEAENLIGDASTESGLKAGWTKDATQYYTRKTEKSGVTVVGTAGLSNLDGTTAVAKYTNGKASTDPLYEEYYFTAKEAVIAKLADSTLTLAIGTEASSRLRSNDAEGQTVTNNTATAPTDSISGTIQVRKYSNGATNLYLTDAEFEAGTYTGYSLVEAEKTTWYVRYADAGADKTVTSCFEKASADVVYTYTNKLNDSKIYATENEFAILVANGTYVADDYTKGDLVYREDGHEAVTVSNDRCTAVNNAYAAQAVSTVYKYTKAGATAYYVTKAEFAALSTAGGVLEGYALDETAGASQVLRYEATKAASAGTISDFASIGLQGLKLGHLELQRTDLTDDEAKALGITYDETHLRCYSAKAVDEWADAAKTTIAGDVANFKTVSLDTMTVTGYITSGSDTRNNTNSSYNKSVRSTKGSDVYTETSSKTTTNTSNAVGTIDLVDTDVLGGVNGYDKVNISTKDATSTIDGVSKNYSTTKLTQNISVKTTDATAYFSQEYTTKDTLTDTTNAKGDLKVAGLRAADDLDIDQSEHFNTPAEAVAEAKKQIDAFGEKKDADIRITGSVSGFKNVSLENVSLGDPSSSSVDTINAYSTKSDSKSSKTTYQLTNNTATTATGNTMTVTSAQDNSSSSSNTIGGDLKLTNVNLAVNYTATSKAEPTPDATEVNTYLFNGKYYALTAEEKAALLPNAKITEGTAQARLDASVTKAATEVKAGQSMLTVTDNGKSDLANDAVYYKTSKLDGEKPVYVKADMVDWWLANDGKGCTVDTSKAFYAGSAATTVTTVITSDVSKYKYNGTTVYLTAAEASILGATAATDTATYTRLTATGGAAVTYAAKDAVKDESNLTEVYKYIGTTTDTVTKEYYLTVAEYEGFKASGVLNSTFAKVGDTKYQRINCAAKSSYEQADLDDIVDRTTTNGLGYVKANCYWDGASDTTILYATAAEFAQLKALDATYKDYIQKAGTETDTYYLKDTTIFDTSKIDDNLAKYQAVNESAEVYEVYNKLNDTVIGYLTRAEYYTLRDNAASGAEAFENIYGIRDDDEKVPPDPTYLRIADDTNDLITINGVDGEGYVVKAADTLKAYAYNVADKTDKLAKMSAEGFRTITMADSELWGADGSLTTTKHTDKVTSKVADGFGKYTETNNTTNKYNVGTFKAVDGVNTTYAEVKGYKTVTLKGELDKDGTALSTFQGFTSGTKTTTSSYSGNVKLVDKGDATYTNADIYDGKTSETTTVRSDGKLDATNVTLGAVCGYKTVKVVFDATDDEKVLAKHTVGAISGGNSDKKVTSTIKTVGDYKVTDATTTETDTSVGTAEVSNATGGKIAGFEKVTVTGSKVGTVAGGKEVTKTVTLTMHDVTGVKPDTVSTDKTVESTALGQATLDDSSATRVTGFKKVVFTNGVKVTGDVSAPIDYVNEDDSSRGVDNTVCYAVTYDYNYVSKTYASTVYLTVDEYEVFVKDEKYADAQIDLSVSTYRTQAELTEEQLAETEVADKMAACFTKNTEEPKHLTYGTGYNGANPYEVIVKSYGQDFSIDKFGAEIGGEVKGYQKVTVDGDSYFAKGYEGTKNADKLVVNADLATFGNLDFGEGKDTLELANGAIFGTDVAFEDWNLETVKVTGKDAKATMLVKSDDVKAVKAAFENVTVVGSDNYSAASALDGQSMDEAISLSTERKEWLGFCDETDYFEAANAGTLKLDGDIFDKGTATAKVSYDDGESWKTIEDGDKVFKGADIKVFLDDDAKNKVSNDYTIAIA